MLARLPVAGTSCRWESRHQEAQVPGSIGYPLAGGGVVPKNNGGPVEQARVAITAVNPAPLLVPGAEHALSGKRVDEHVATVVGELAAKVAKPLTTSALTPEYRRGIGGGFSKRPRLTPVAISLPLIAP